MHVTIPDNGNYPAYYPGYFKLVEPSTDVLQQLHDDAEKFAPKINSIPDEKLNFAYAEGKWTVAQVIQHIIDTERILCYRILSIARGEQNSLPGFDENAYNATANLSHKNKTILSLEWLTVRQASFSLVFGLTREELLKIGKANNASVSAEAIVCMMVAHARHHFNVIDERYL